MFFGESKKNAGRSILEHFESKYPRERDEKPYWKEAPLSPMSKGGEVDEDPEHMEALSSHSEAMHDAMQKGDFKAHARAMKSFIQEHEMHKHKKEEQE